MVWGKRNTPIEVAMTNERERQTYYGAINLLTNTVHLQELPGVFEKILKSQMRGRTVVALAG